MTLCCCTVFAGICNDITEFVKIIQTKLTVASDLIEKFSLFINIQFKLQICCSNGPIKYIDNVIDNTMKIVFFSVFSVF